MDFEQRRKLAKRDSTHAKHIPYAYHLDANTVCTRDGALVQIIQLQGLKTQTMDDQDRVHAKAARANFYREVVDPRLTIYSHTVRRPVQLANTARFEDDFFQSMNDRWYKHLNTEGLYVTENYIALVWRQDWGATAALRNFSRLFMPALDAADYKKQQVKGLAHLNRLAEKTARRFSAYNTKRLGINQFGQHTTSEVLSFLHYLINGERKTRLLPTSDLAYFLPTNSHTFAMDHFEIRTPTRVRHGAVLAVKEDFYPTTTDQGQLDPLLSLKREFVITQSFQFIDKKTAKDSIKLQQGHLVQADDDALTLLSELNKPIDELESNIIRMGKYHFSVVALEDSRERLEESIQDLDRALAEANIAPVREDLNMEAAFWAQLPGNESYRARCLPINNKNFAGLASLHGESLGRAKGNRWGDALAVFPTINGSPFYFNFHQAKDERLEGGQRKPSDKGHTSIIGPNGTGKTLLLAFLLVMLQKKKNRVVYFDKDRANEILIRAMGGAYSIISPEHRAGFNPLQMEDTKSNRDYIQFWFEMLCTASGEVVSAGERKQIEAMVEANFAGLDFADRRLCNAVDFLGPIDVPGSLRERLSPWYGTGSKAYLFDNPEDNFNLSGHVVGMDLTHVLNDPFIQVPVISYLFHRIEESLDGVTPTVVAFDEGWAYVANPHLEAKLGEQLKTIRKKEGVVVFMSQDPADSAKCNINSTLNQEMVTKIFLANRKGDKSNYCDYFGLTEKEFEWVTTIDPEEHQVLVMKDDESVVLNMDMHALDEFIHILSGRKGNLAVMESLRQTHGNEVEQWRSLFLDAVQ